jgi:hypothetical protein
MALFVLATRDDVGPGIEFPDVSHEFSSIACFNDTRMTLAGGLAPGALRAISPDIASE